MLLIYLFYFPNNEEEQWRNDVFFLQNDDLHVTVGHTHPADPVGVEAEKVKRDDWKGENGKLGTVENAGVENARTENAAPKCRDGKGENIKRGTKVQGWKRRENVYIVLIFS